MGQETIYESANKICNTNMEEGTAPNCLATTGGYRSAYLRDVSVFDFSVVCSGCDGSTTVVNEKLLRYLLWVLCALAVYFGVSAFYITVKAMVI